LIRKTDVGINVSRCFFFLWLYKKKRVRAKNSITNQTQSTFFVVQNNNKQSSMQVSLLTSHHIIAYFHVSGSPCANPFFSFPPNLFVGRRKKHARMTSMKSKNMNLIIIRRCVMIACSFIIITVDIWANYHSDILSCIMRKGITKNKKKTKNKV